MRFAVLSDVHGNLEALQAVLADARQHRCTHFVCLGDIVGYNADPSACIRIVRELDCPTVKGNHDEQASLSDSSVDFNEMAEQAIMWTRAQLSEEDRSWLRHLPLQQFLVFGQLATWSSRSLAGRRGRLLRNAPGGLTLAAHHAAELTPAYAGRARDGDCPFASSARFRQPVRPGGA